MTTKASQHRVPRHRPRLFLAAALCAAGAGWLLASVTFVSPSAPRSMLHAATVPGTADSLRILLVDDDWSDNNHYQGDTRVSRSDTVMRRLVAAAVGGNPRAWAIETVQPYGRGPDLDKLRNYSLVVWYTGANYGGNPDNSSVLSVEDEKVVRRYLEDVGGTVMLISPGYVQKTVGVSAWDQADWPFLTEVMGLRGGVGFAQRGDAGTVSTPDGAQFSVGRGRDVESLFSTVNPAGARVVLTARLAGARSAGGADPVATVFPYGKGRLVYVGFTFENLAETDLTPAFQVLLAASAPTVLATGEAPRSGAPAPSASAPEAEPATVQVTGMQASAIVSWTVQTATVVGATLGPVAQSSRTIQSTTGTGSGTSEAPTARVERLVPNGPPVPLILSAPGALQARDPGPLLPGQTVTYRVTLTYASGATGFKEATYTPPAAADPTGLTGVMAADGTVTLSWQPVENASGYQITGTSLTAPVVVRSTTRWISPPQLPGSQQWKVASLYAPDVVLTSASAWPSVTTRLIPTPKVQYLSLPAGLGSQTASQAHYRTRCTGPIDPDAYQGCPDLFALLDSATNFNENWLNEVNDMPTSPKWDIAAFADLNDLGLGRRVNCVPRRGTTTTVCWATSHGDIPAVGTSVNGTALAHAGEHVLGIKSITVIVMSGDKSFFGVFEADGSRLPGGSFGPFDREFNYVRASVPSYGIALDNQGRKSVPHACLSCHGGRYDPESRMVVGASLLPLVPANLTFSSPQARASAEEPIRRINQTILESNPSPAIRAQIVSMYNGTPTTPSTRANDAAVPAGWSEQPGLYRQVVAPYCGSCHFAQTGPLNFGTFRNLMDNKTRIQRAVCVDYSMPHSEQGFRRFWSEGGAVSLPGLLSTVLGYPKCSQ